MHHELGELIKEIEVLRAILIKVKQGRSYTDPEVVDASQELDYALDKYHVMLVEK